MASIGAKMDKADITMEVPVSTVETIGLAKPAVVAVEANLVVLVDAFTAVAVPPPAIIANAQVIAGLKSATVETITAVPAMAARGMAMASNRLSSQGIK